MLTPIPKSVEASIDNRHVDRFAAAMKAKLGESREKGRHGWFDTDVCSDQELAQDLILHVFKGDPVDIANYCMMLHQRGVSSDVISKAAVLKREPRRKTK